jgi:hypothetical protein
VDDRRDDLGLPMRVRLRPTAVGRGLPVPPLIPLVAIACLLVGLAAGYGIAPNHAVSTPSPASPTPEVTVAPTDVYLFYPADGIMTFPAALPTESAPATGLSLKRALSALEGLGWGLPPSTVVSARVDRFGNVGWDSSYPPEQWVWVFVVTGGTDDTVVCTTVAAEASADPYAPPAAPTIPASSSPDVSLCRVVSTEATVILDYTTGDLIEAQSTTGGH